MFQSVIETQRMGSGRFGTGAVISFTVHAGLVLGVLWLTAEPRAVEHVEPEVGTLVVLEQPPRGTPKPTPQARTAPAKPRPRPSALAKPAPKPLQAASPAPPSEAAPGDPPADDVGPEGDPDAVDVIGKLGTTFVPNAVVGTPPTGEEVLPLGPGMTLPRLLAGPELRYTPEALAARVEGTLVVKCVITREGDAERCRVLKGLPHLSESVRASLEQRRYTPVTFQGRPVSVSYTFNVRLQLPR